MGHRILSLTGWLVLGAILFATAYLRLQLTFMPYDDEGYILISLRNHLAGLRLYDDVFSQYGPWTYLYNGTAARALGMDMTHALGRILTAIHWTATALLCGRLGWKLTGSQVAALVTAITAFGLTWQMASEPSHPGSHIALLVALAAVLIAGLADTPRPRLGCALLGVIAGLLLMTKINIGLLLSIGLGFLALRQAGWGERWRGPAAGLAVAGLVVLPWVYFGVQLKYPWVLIFAVQFTLAGALLGWLAVPRSDSPRLPPGTWLVVPLGCLVTVGLIGLWAMHRGTSTGSLLRGILLNPLQLPANFRLGIPWYPEVWLLDLVSLFAVLKAGWEMRTRGQPAPNTIWLVVGVRLLGLLWFFLHAHEWIGYYGTLHFGVYCLPMLPVFLVPLAAGGSPTRGWAVGGVAVLALLQVLHAYPVAASQLAWGTFLCVPVFVAGLFEAIAVLGQLPVAAARRGARAIGPVLLGICLFQLGAYAKQGWTFYATAKPLGLPGAGDLRPDAATRQALRLLSLNAQIHAERLFSRPGMFSHNLWSGVPTPTAQNATQWSWLLNETQQREILRRLSQTGDVALITSDTVDRFMADHGISAAGVLDDFVREHYVPLFSYGGFTFSLPAGAEAVAFGRYELLETEAAGTNDQTVLFRTCLALDGRVGAIRLELLEHPWTAGPELLTATTQVVAEPIDRAGHPVGESIQLRAGQELKGLFRLSIISPRLPSGFPWQDHLLVVRNVEGRVLSESVY